MIWKFAAILIAALMIGCGSENPAQEFPQGEFFTVQVLNETFQIFVTDPETIRLAKDNFQGKNSRFPSGRIVRGNGGFNQPWSWHLCPKQS